MNEFDQEREANIARNLALLAQLDLPQLIPTPVKGEGSKAKPIQPRKKVKKEQDPVTPRQTRQSARLRKTVVDPNETPTMKRKREVGNLHASTTTETECISLKREEEQERRREEAERLEAEEKARQAKRPRHEDLDISTLGENMEPEDLTTLSTAMEVVLNSKYPRRVSSHDAFVFDTDTEEEAEVKELRSRLKKLKIVSRAKVTQNRVYCAAYHPEVTKDLIFFGDKHGELGIWDARDTPDELADEDGDVTTAGQEEGGRYWRLQCHWPATSKSSISAIKFDPLDSHIVYTSAYDCTIRRLSFSSGVCREVFSLDETLISSFDVDPEGYELWISDTVGGVTHLDVREDKSKARRYQLSEAKIGTVSLNPVNTNFLLTGSNNRILKIWDVRKLASIRAPKGGSQEGGPIELDDEIVGTYLSSKSGKSCQRAEWRHDKAVSSAYWDPRGRSIVSTSYDDKIRMWDIKPNVFDKDSPFPSSRPIAMVQHDCQTGRWVTPFKAQWSPNPDVYPHFTIGNMRHSIDIFSCKGDLLARLSDSSMITAVQAVTCSHPSIVERAASGNGSGRCVLWAPEERDE